MPSRYSGQRAKARRAASHPAHAAQTHRITPSAHPRATDRNSRNVRVGEPGAGEGDRSRHRPGGHASGEGQHGPGRQALQGRAPGQLGAARQVAQRAAVDEAGHAAAEAERHGRGEGEAQGKAPAHGGARPPGTLRPPHPPPWSSSGRPDREGDPPRRTGSSAAGKPPRGRCRTWLSPPHEVLSPAVRGALLYPERPERGRNGLDRGGRGETSGVDRGALRLSRIQSLGSHPVPAVGTRSMARVGVCPPGLRARTRGLRPFPDAGQGSAPHTRRGALPAARGGPRRRS